MTESATETVTEPRLMAKVFDVARVTEEKDGQSVSRSGLQSKINSWTNGKNIGEIHNLTLASDNGSTKAVIVYEALPGEPSKADRVFAKVVEGAKLGESALQTKVNAFSKDKKITVKAVASTLREDGEAILVILHTKEGGEEA